MSQFAEFEGKVHEFPDDFSQADIATAFSSISPAKWGDVLKSLPGRFLGGAVQGVGGNIQAVGENSYQANYAAERGGNYSGDSGEPDEFAASWVAKKLGKTPEQVKTEWKAAKVENPTSKLGATIADQGQAEQDAATPAGKETFTQRAVGSGVISAAAMAPAIAASVLSKNPTPMLTQAALSQHGQTYAESRAAGLSPEESSGHAAIDAAAEAGFELLPAKYLTDHAASSGLLHLVKEMALREVPAEVMTTAVQQLNAKYGAQPNMTWKEYGQSLLDTIGSVAVATPLMAGMGHVAGRVGAANEAAPVEAAPVEAAAPVNDTVNAPLTIPSTPVASPTPPAWHWPTADTAPGSLDGLDAQLAQIDPSTITPDQVAAANAHVEAFRQSTMAPPIPGAKEAWGVLDASPTLDSGELGASLKQSNNAGAYTNPNVEDRADRTIMYGPEGTEGLTPNQVAPQPATYTLGVESTDRSRDYLKAIHDTVEQWRQKWMPDSVFVISNEQLPYDNALGWHYSQNGAHIIVPAPIRSPTRGLGSFNSNTQVSAFYNLSHEFGHALTEAQFYTGAQPMSEQLADKESAAGIVSEQTIALFPEAQQAVIREFNAMKESVLAGTISAADFVNKWMSPGKAGRKNILKGVDPAGPATALVQKIASQASSDPTQIQVIANSLLSLKEYLAEQMARHAYASKLDQGTPIGQYFAKALASLRGFFIDQKRDGIIAPGIAFTHWIEGLTKHEQVTNGPEQKQTALKGKKKVVAQVAAPTATGPPPVQRTQHNVETDTHAKKLEDGKGLIMDLFETGKLAIGSPDAVKMLNLLKTHDYDEFTDLYKKHAGNKIQFQVEGDREDWAPDARTLLEEQGLWTLHRPTGDLHVNDEELLKTLADNGFDNVTSEDLRQYRKGTLPSDYPTYLAIRQILKPLTNFGSFDLEDSPQQVTYLKGLQNFLSNPAPLRMALRKFTNAQWWSMEIQQLAHLHPDLEHLRYFSEQIIKYNSQKSALQATPDFIVHAWEKQGKENWDKINKILLDEMDGKVLWWNLSRASGQWQYEMSQRAYDELKARGVDAATVEGQELAALVLQVKNNLLDNLNTKETVLRKLLASRLPNASTQTLMQAYIPLMAKIHEYRTTPFFPQGRFGKWMLIIENHKATGGYEVIHREAFESKADRDAAHDLAFKNKKPNERVSIKELTDQTYTLMSIPTDFVDLAASELDLDSKEMEILQGLLQPVKPEKALAQYDLSRLGIKGHSMDAMRSFANYTWHDANLLAKLEYRAEFNRAIRGTKALLRQSQFQGPTAEEQVNLLTRAHESMERTRDYMMAPPYEAQGLRATVSLAFLGLNVKTALLNTLGLMTTWSHLTSETGLGKGSINFLDALNKTRKTIKLTDLNAMKPSALPPNTQRAMDQALKDGVLSQSYAYHLAGVANAGNLFRMPSRQLARRAGKKAADIAMSVFRLTELATRRASFIAIFEQEMKKPNAEFQSSYEEAVRRTNLLQNDYSLGNRVPFMRGVSLAQHHPLKKVIEPIIPLATVFMSFAQHAAFHAYGGYELGERRAQKLAGETPRSVMGGYTMKLMALYLLLAGYEGLPGAENILDLVEFLWRRFGGKKPMRQELRELVQSVEFMDLDPQMAAHGLGHNVAGFDVSRSIGLGKLVPGTETLSQQSNDFNSTVGLFVFDMFGATGSLAKFGLEGLYSNKPMSQTLQHFPGGLGNMWTAYEWSQQGVRAPSGAVVTHGEDGKLRDLNWDEIAGKALGFNPTAVSQARETRFEQYDQQLYWQSRRKMLNDDIWTARWQGDKEAEQSARKAVQDFNSSIPAEYKQLRLTGKDIAESLHTHMKQKQADEQQTTTRRRFKAVYSDVKDSLEP